MHTTNQFATPAIPTHIDPVNVFNALQVAQWCENEPRNKPKRTHCGQGKFAFLACYVGCNQTKPLCFIQNEPKQFVAHRDDRWATQSMRRDGRLRPTPWYTASRHEGICQRSTHRESAVRHTAPSRSPPVPYSATIPPPAHRQIAVPGRSTG